MAVVSRIVYAFQVLRKILYRRQLDEAPDQRFVRVTPKYKSQMEEKSIRNPKSRLAVSDGKQLSFQVVRALKLCQTFLPPSKKASGLSQWVLKYYSVPYKVFPLLLAERSSALFPLCLTAA